MSLKQPVTTDRGLPRVVDLLNTSPVIRLRSVVAFKLITHYSSLISEIYATGRLNRIDWGW
jgi:hypothetical protein